MELLDGGYVILYCKVDAKGKKLDNPEARRLHRIDARMLFESSPNDLYSYTPFLTNEKIVEPEENIKPVTVEEPDEDEEIKKPARKRATKK